MEEPASINVTEFPFENTTFPDGYEDLLMKTNLTVKIYIELYTILSLICVACNIIIAFVIIKYRRLRLDKSNIILLNWTIVNNLFMITSPISQRLSTDWETYFAAYTFFCSLEQTQYCILLANLLLVDLLLINWYLKVYHTVIYEKFVNYLNYILVAIYVPVIISTGVHVSSCFEYRLITSEVFLLISYLKFIVFMIAMNIVHLVKRRRLAPSTVTSNMPLYLVNTYFLSICPLLLAIFSHLLLHDQLFSLIILIGGLILAVMNPIYFFIILYNFDKDYRTFFGHVFSSKCCEYKDDELQEEPVVFNGSVQLG
nr:uncharacterized protein LOC111515617 [Leptinotarsa decemlineata]